MKLYLEFEVEIKNISYSPGKPAYTSGLPENCHDGEPEEIEYEVWLHGIEISEKLSKHDHDEIEERIRDDYWGY